MKFKLKVLICFMSVSTGFCMRVQMPHKKVLKDQFYNMELNYFTEKTSIIDQLDRKEVSVEEFVTIVESALMDYDEYVKNPWVSYAMQRKKPDIFRNLLQHSPEALKELERLCLDKTK